MALPPRLRVPLEAPQGIVRIEGLEHPDLASVVHFSLYTSNAHGIYAKLGFERSGDGNYMRLERRPDR